MSDGSTSEKPSRIPLPEGTVPVGIGLFISGFTAYAFFKVGQLALGKEDFKPIVALWFTTFALVPGFFMPVEQELGRALAPRRALGNGGGPVVRRMIPLTAALAAALTVAHRNGRQYSMTPVTTVARVRRLGSSRVVVVRVKSVEPLLALRLTSFAGTVHNVVF